MDDLRNAGQAQTDAGTEGAFSPRKQPTPSSILFGPPESMHESMPERVREPPAAIPACFRDLNFDRIVSGMVMGRETYDLDVFFHQPLSSVDAVAWRHEVFHDLDRPPVADAITTFCDRIRQVRATLARAAKLFNRYQMETWELGAACRYVAAVTDLAGALDTIGLSSRGLIGFRDWIGEYRAGAYFRDLVAQTEKVKSGLSAVKYTLLIRGDKVRVRRYEDEPDYGAAVEKTFEKFQQGEVSDYTKSVGESVEMNHVETGILDLVGKLFPDEFGALDGFAADWSGFLDPVVVRFERETQFYLAVAEYTGRLRRAGLEFCYPRLSDTDKAISATDCFDLALAGKLVAAGKPIVTNSFHLEGQERIFVITGPNQGGKTTFARMFGQLHYLAALGCPVPGRDGRFFLFDRIFLHFEREESIATGRGKLEDDLFRIHEILEQATSRSIIIINEIFTSTTLFDAIEMGGKILARIIERDVLCVCVTFLDELSRLGPTVVSAVSTVVPDDPARRTFRIVRKPADGNAFAIFLAQRYGLTSAQIARRIAP